MLFSAVLHFPLRVNFIEMEGSQKPIDLSNILKKNKRVVFFIIIITGVTEHVLL